MQESRTDLNIPGEFPASRNRSTGALILFVLLALLMPFCLLVYHLILWTTEQTAIADASQAQLGWAGLIGLAIQGIVLSAVFALLWRLTTDLRFKPVYVGWLVAALMAFPGLLLRLLGPNNDQLGSILQILICVVMAIIMARLGGTRLGGGSASIAFAFLLAAFGVGPFAIFGAFGAVTDALLSLLAGLAFGWLAAVLMEASTENRFLDALGIGALLALLGSAIGYDGAQLILLAILPSFAFAVGTLMPSRAAAAVLTGLIAAAGLIFFDPTELTIVLGDETGLALKAVGFAVGLGLSVGLAALIIRMIASSEMGASAGLARVLGAVGAVGAWVVVILLFVTNGHHGFYGDRLFVILKDQADLSSIRQISDIRERRTAAYQTLTKRANETQAVLRKTFDEFGIKYTPYYLVNAMEVRGGTLVRLYLLTRPEVDRVIPSPRLRPGGPEPSLPSSGGDTPPSGVQWNVTMIGADKVWDRFGARGKGIVIGQSDSGVDVNHPELRDSYRGRAEGNDYNWFDPWNHKPAPYDENGHGTHTLGTILGKNGIGIAPDATWFACANLNRNLGNPALYLDCMQFMLAPFPQNGNPLKDGDAARAADVLNNSWGCPELEGCDPDALLAAANHLRDAGIFVAASTGNDGPNCSTVEDPLALYDSVFSVGAIDRSGDIAYFSSRGPVTADGSGRIKPDIVAPGVDVLSSVPGGGYAAESGTSMAGPHVAGAVALLWSADPALIGDIDRTEQLLIKSADPYAGSQSGCFEGSVPNAAYGYGVLDVYQAVKMALGK